MAVMVAGLLQWLSVSDGLGGQQTYTEDSFSAMSGGSNGLAVSETSAVPAVPLEAGVQGTSPIHAGDLQEPSYFDSDGFPPSIPPPPTATPVVEAATYSGVLSEEEMRALLAEAGAPEAWIAPMLTIANCESKYSPGAVGDSGNSLGLYQLWSGWFYAGEDPFDPLTNTRVAVRVREIRGRFGSKGGWSCADLNNIP